MHYQTARSQDFGAPGIGRDFAVATKGQIMPGTQQDATKADKIDVASSRLSQIVMCNPHDIDPASFLGSFSLSTEQRTHLADLNTFCRSHELGLLLYAHLYKETCRTRHVAVLSHHADRHLQRYWEVNRERLVGEVLEAFFADPAATHETLERLAARALETVRELRSASDDEWGRANDAAYDAQLAFRWRFFAVTGLEPQRLSQLQMEGVL